MPFEPSITDRTAAVIDIAETERSKIDLPPETSATTQPQYYEVVATAASAATTTKKPAVTEAPKEYFTVKFVDTDGYTSISVQTVVEGGSAIPPTMPEKRGDLIFRGWDKDYTNIRRGTIVKAIYQKEWLTVRFFDADATLLKTEQVRYGESATPPEVKDKSGYLFDGWNALFNDVTEGYFAAKLIDDAGLRGFSVGGAMVSEKHCGFVINYNNATSTDVFNLMKEIKAVVYDKFGVILEPEVRFVGNFSEF